MAATALEGLEPLAVWDGRVKDWGAGWSVERLYEFDDWMREHIARHRDVCRFEVYLLDTAFAVVTRYRRGSNGRWEYADGRIATEPPAAEPLAELPPEHLLRG